MISATQPKEARERLGWSLPTLAGKYEVGATSIRNFETGRHRPSSFKVFGDPPRSRPTTSISTTRAWREVIEAERWQEVGRARA